MINLYEAFDIVKRIVGVQIVMARASYGNELVKKGLLN